MSVECSECEWDARAGHDPDCSRDPANKLRAENERLRELVRRALACEENDYRLGEDWIADAEAALSTA